MHYVELVLAKLGIKPFSYSLVIQQVRIRSAGLCCCGARHNAGPVGPQALLLAQSSNRCLHILLGLLALVHSLGSVPCRLSDSCRAAVTILTLWSLSH